MLIIGSGGGSNVLAARFTSSMRVRILGEDFDERGRDFGVSKCATCEGRAGMLRVIGRGSRRVLTS